MPVQKALLATYRMVRRTRILDTALGRWTFVRAYWLYKELWEPDSSYLGRLVSDGQWIIDIGANVGFYTKRFATLVHGAGRVLAFEPEASNYRYLLRVASSCPVVLAEQALVADQDGQLLLSLNLDHPADHKIGAAGVPTRATTLDSDLARRGWPPVGLVKIDVQGAESRVLAGALETIKRNRPALLVEVDDEGLRSFGSSALELEDTLLDAGYAMYDRDFVEMGRQDAARMRSTLGYADILFVHRSSLDARSERT